MMNGQGRARHLLRVWAHHALVFTKQYALLAHNGSLVEAHTHILILTRWFNASVLSTCKHIATAG